MQQYVIILIKSLNFLGSEFLVTINTITKKDIKKGTFLSDKNLTVKRPGTGSFPANKLSTLFGKKARRDLNANILIGSKDVT